MAPRTGQPAGASGERRVRVASNSLIAGADCLREAQMKTDSWCSCGVVAGKGYLGIGRRERPQQEPSVSKY